MQPHEIILLSIGGVICALLLFMILRTILTKPRQVEILEYNPSPLDKDVIAEHLSEAVKIPTISLASPEYSDKPFYDFKDFILRTYPLFASRAKLTVISKYSLIFDLEGTDPKLLPACFLSHIDVVPANDEGWEVEPFSGKVKDGYVWGRGSQDMKGQMIALLESLEYLLSQGKCLKRSIYCCFGHDEEITTRQGAPKIVEFLQKKGIRCEFVLDEGGTILNGKMLGLNQNIALIGTSEKGYADITISKKCDGGHASTPKKPTALASVCDSIARVEKKQMKPLWSAPVKELLKCLAPYTKPLLKFALVNRDILSPLIKFALTKIHPVAASLVKTTFAPTMMKGSDAKNVLPMYAEANVNCRLMIGNSLQDTLNHVKRVTKKYKTDISLAAGTEATPVSPINTAAYKDIESCIRTIFPGVLSAPFIFIAATDARFFYPISDNVYRFTPFMTSEEDQKRIHAINERCEINALKQATEFFIAVVEKTCG